MRVNQGSDFDDCGRYQDDRRRGSWRGKRKRKSRNKRRGRKRKRRGRKGGEEKGKEPVAQRHEMVIGTLALL